MTGAVLPLRASGAGAPAHLQRPVTVAELRAALTAARRGDFAAAAWGEHTPGVGSRIAWPATAGQDRGCPAVAVLAGHAGAGASTVALAVADAAATAGIRVTLADCAEPGRSGLAAVTTAELGVDASGWRLGRRGAVQVDRLADRIGAIEDIPTPRVDPVGPTGVGRLLVVDIGWPAGTALTAGGWVTELLAGELVVVCRASVPGVRQTEQLIAELPRPPLVAVIGPTRWPGVVTASCGPGLRAAKAADRMVCLPVAGPLEVTGLTADPLPKSLAAAGRELAELIGSRTPQRTADDIEQEKAPHGD